MGMKPIGHSSRNVVIRYVAALLATCVALPANAQSANFCTAAGGKTQLGFNVKPSLVAHGDAIMETTFGDAQISGGDPNEKLFSFRRTIGAILKSVNKPDDQAAREVFVRTMLDTFPSAKDAALNPFAGVLMPVDARTAERNLTATDLLNEASPNGMRPLAVFNRFDLAPENWAHCGEYRIVYGKNPPDPFPPNPFVGRFFLIFEAALPNPDPGSGEAGCRPVTEFWASLSRPQPDGDIGVARRLSAFFYDGKTDPSLPVSNLKGPVVNYRNYGGDGGRGQVRGNLFMAQPWQLREWLTQPTFDSAKPLAFVVETVKDNLLAELYMDDLSGVADLTNDNVPAALTALHGSFVAALTSDIGDNLMAEETDKHRKLADEVVNFDLGSGAAAEVDEAKILLNTIALGNEPQFNEFQSTSQGPTDDISVLAGTKLRGVLARMGATSRPNLGPQTADVILNRAQAPTCAGCHMLSPGDIVRQDPDGGTVTWPPVAALGFVHVREDRVLSGALEESFLPFRRYVLGRHLCPGAVPTPALVVASGVGGPTPASAADARRGGMRFVDGLISDYLAGRQPIREAAAPAAPAAEPPDMVMAAARQLAPPERDALRQKVHEAIAEARRLEHQLPGAFVETRRPH